MKDIKHIRRDNHSVPWVMPQDLRLGGAGGQKFNFLNMVMWHITLKGMRGSRNFRQVQVSRTKKSSDNVFFFFFLVLSLFYRFKWSISKKSINFSRFQRGSNFFQGGSSCLFPIETLITFLILNPERDFFSFMSKRRKYANVLEQSFFQHQVWPVYQGKSYLHRIALPDFYIVSSFFYKRSKQARVPTFVWLFRNVATTAKGPGCEEGTNLR